MSASRRPKRATALRLGGTARSAKGAPTTPPGEAEDAAQG